MLEYEEDEWSKAMREATMRTGLLLDQQVRASEKLRESMTSLINSNNSVVRAQKDMMLQQETANQRVNMLVDTVRNLVDTIKRQSISAASPIQNKSIVCEEITESVHEEESKSEKEKTNEEINSVPKEIEIKKAPAVKRKIEIQTRIPPKRVAKDIPRRDPNFVYQLTSTKPTNESEEYQIYRSIAEVYRDPTSYKSAMNSKESLDWQAAVNEELRSMEENNVWNLVERPSQENIIDSRWVFKKKMSPNAEAIYRARLVVRGFKDTNDYEIRETYAPVSRMTDLVMAKVMRCSTWEGVLATTRCHHLVAGRARVEQRELGMDEANPMAHESTLSLMRAPRLPHSSTSRQRDNTACVCNHTSNEQNETSMTMIESSVLAGSYDRGVPLRTVGLLHRGGFYEHGLAIARNESRIAELDGRLSSEVKELQHTCSEQALVDIRGEVARLASAVGTIAAASGPTLVSPRCFDNCEVRLSGFPPQLNPCDRPTVERVLAALEEVELLPHVIHIRQWNPKRRAPAAEPGPTDAPSSSSDAVACVLRFV
ncbi:unnamed protein product [Trichogramma brassicae]|uniref:Reverse transcriptase Ty1/copia-type domain-containing protein n=1 Tax=Trichogramma brassicae TaxID=86971 RepID=A0A6H5IMW4_9HYME|nr:unnamed protein product [Trichogramma brassicae]